MREDGRVVVVGSGPAGAAAAVLLRQAGAQVLVLEAGSEGSALGVTMRVQGLTVLRVHRPLRQRNNFVATADPNARLYEDLAPGGLTNHWSCAVPRFSPDDFEDGARAGEPYTWPIGYSDLAPWYDRVEPWLHIAGAAGDNPQLPPGVVRNERRLRADWIPLAEEARRLGRTVAPTPYVYGADTTLTFSGTVFNSFVRLLRPDMQPGGVTTRYGARVLRLEWSKTARRVEAVVFRDARTRTENRVPCRAVVLAAGAIASSEILLASSSAEFPDGLGNSHGVLGHYLHDHPLGKLVLDLASPLSFYPPAYVTRPTLDRAPPLYAAACLQWTGVGFLAKSMFQRKLGRLPWVGFNVFGTMAPSHDNWVRLSPADRDAAGTRRLEVHIRHPPAAQQALDQAKNDVIEALGRVGLNPTTRLWNVEPVGESVHYGGTCRMHASPRYGMIDAWNRLHAVPNVAVVDSSAFTTGPEKNPVLTAMSLAARAAHRLADELRSGDL